MLGNGWHLPCSALASGYPDGSGHRICYMIRTNRAEPLSKRRYLAAARDNAILDECGIPIDMNHSLLTQSLAESGHRYTNQLRWTYLMSRLFLQTLITKLPPSPSNTLSPRYTKPIKLPNINYKWLERNCCQQDYSEVLSLLYLLEQS